MFCPSTPNIATQAFDVLNVRELIALFYEIYQFAFPNHLDFHTMQIIVTMHTGTCCH
jgi:hypothetical protein